MKGGICVSLVRLAIKVFAVSFVTPCQDKHHAYGKYHISDGPTRLKWLVALIFLVSTTVNYAKDDSNAIPLEIFGKNRYINDISLSPDGKHLAALIYYNGAHHIAVADFEQRQLEIIFTAKLNERNSFRWLTWGSNTRILASYKWLRQKTGLKTSGGYDLDYTRLMALDIDGKNVKSLEYDISKANRGSKAGGRKQRIFNSVNQDLIIDSLPHDPDHILISLDGGREFGAFHVYKLNIHTAEYTRVKKKFQNIHYWETDRQHKLRLGIARDENARYRVEYHYLDPKSSKWEKIYQWTVFKDDDSHFLGFNHSGDKMYFRSSRDTDTMSLHVFDLKTMTMSNPIFTHDTVDVNSIYYDYSKNKVIGLTYLEHFNKVHYFDEDDAEFQKQIDRFLPNTNNIVIQQSLDGSRRVISASSSTQPERYFLYDQKKNSLKPWYQTRPDIKPELMSEVKPITLKARDGMTLYGYVTLPGDAGESLPPVVVYPHGGPWSRDTGYFDPFSQAMASRGYAVLQLNFRGSTGYGAKYEVAGYHQWGKKMQEDLVDGLKWLGEQKIADSSKACIMGMSYGGYAALMGVIKDPELYKCAISFAGVADLVRLAIQEDIRGSYFGPMVGDQGSREIRSTSPYHHVEKIKAPVLLMHGKRDVVVNSIHTEDMAKKMTRLGKKVELKLFENGDHHLTKEQTRIRVIKEIDRFLSKHLPIK